MFGDAELAVCIDAACPDLLLPAIVDEDHCVVEP